MRKILAFSVVFLLIISVLPVMKATVEDEWMAIPPSYSEKYDDDGDGNNDSHKVQIDASTDHDTGGGSITVHAKGRMYDRYDDTPLTPWVQVDWQIRAPGGVNQPEWSPEMHFNVPDGYTPKEGFPYVRTKTFISLYDDEWNLEQNGDYEYGPWEIRHNLYPPASNDPPVLSNGYVTPTSGDTSTLFYYYVHYYDANGDAPTQRDACIDGSSWHTMTHHNGSVSDGYYRLVLTLSPGTHNFYFKFSDGVNPPVLLPSSGTYPGPTVSASNDPPVLSNGYVTPTSGNTSTLFYYYVHYYDPDGNSPTQKDVVVDGSDFHTMGLHNGTASNGFYSCILTLSPGVHNFYFKFSDGVNPPVLLPPSDTYPGPTVSATNVYLIKRYFPVYNFSAGENWYPCSFYFDGNGETWDDLYNKESYDSYTPSPPPYYAYVHVTENSTHKTIQYWLYYVWNSYFLVGDHNSEWDSTVFVILEKTGVELDPVQVYYFFHYSKECLSWDDWPEKDDTTHPVVYVAEGSHGAYPSPEEMVVDVWQPDGRILRQGDFNWYLVGDSLDHAHDYADDNYCNITVEWIEGEPQWEFDSYWWPREFPQNHPLLPRDPLTSPWHRPEDWGRVEPLPNDQPVLSDGYVTPVGGGTSTLFYYYVHYYDPEGIAPVNSKQLCVDGAEWHTMGLHNGTASNGFYSCILTLSPGVHNFYFKFSDGVNPPVLLPSSGTYPGPTVSASNDPPVLSNGYVTPTSGNTSTLFYYYVHYYDADGDAPTQKDVVINGSDFHTMTHHNGSVSNGYYSCILTLSSGDHNYYFKFSDGVNPPVLLPSSGTYPGPTVYPSGQVELFYDDGEAEAGYAPTLGFYTYAVHFQTPTDAPYKLGLVKYFIYDKPASFRVDIRDASLQQLYFGLVAPAQAGWFLVDLTPEEIFVQGDFYVGMKYSQLYQPELGADFSDPDGESGESLTGFPTPNLSSLDWMIRAVIEPFHDVAVTSITTYKTIVAENSTATINATVSNQGTYEESFNVNAYANTTIIGTELVLGLLSGNSRIITFTWNTTDFAYGNYTISAVADTIPTETDTADNTYVDGWVIVTIPGDIDGDGDVDPDDFYVFSGAYGSSVGDPAYNPEADLDGDGDVDPDDFFIFSGNYGSSI